jgi:hypothetical protein
VSFTGRVTLFLGVALMLLGSLAMPARLTGGIALIFLGLGMCIGLVIVWIDARRWAA